MARVVWTDRALTDLEAAALYIERDSPTIAHVFIERVFGAVERLEAFPESGRIVPEFGQASVRELVLYSYRIVYRYRHDEVEIIAVHHGARQIPDHL